MSADFYLDEKMLASYFEKDWFDQVIRKSRPKDLFQFPGFHPDFLSDHYHARLIEFLSSVIQEHGLRPEIVLEVGSSLGRTFYELCRHISSIRRATLLEPSENLSSTFRQIFEGGVHSFPVRKGLGNLGRVQFESDFVRESILKVDFSLTTQSFQEFQQELSADLVVCSNVIDQVESPSELLEFLKARVATGGCLLFSCSYQWKNEDSFLDFSKENLENIFGPNWKLLGETNLPFHLRKNERYWLQFMSHVMLLRKF